MHIWKRLQTQNGNRKSKVRKITFQGWYTLCNLSIMNMGESESPSAVSDSSWPHGLWNSPGQNTGVGSLSLLQGIFSTQGSNPGLPHCRRIFYQVSHKGSPEILKWAAYPFSSGSSPPRNQTSVSCIAGRFFLKTSRRCGLEYTRNKRDTIFRVFVCDWKIVSLINTGGELEAEGGTRS